MKLTPDRARAFAMARSTLGWLRTSGGAVLCVLAVAVMYWILVRRLVFGPIAFDESYFLWTGWSLNHHMIPYREFVEYKPVTVFFINALSLKLFGLEYHRYRYLFVILTLAAFVSLAWALCRRGADRTLTFCAVCAIQLGLLAGGLHDSSLNDTETIGMSFLLLGIACLLWGGRRVRLHHGLGGAFLALAVLSKEPYAFVSLGTWIALGFWNRSEQGLSWRRFAAYTTLGAGIVVGVVVVFMLVTRAIPFYISVMREYFGYCTRIGCLQPKTVHQLVTTAWDKIDHSLLTPELVGGLVPFLVGFAILGPASLGCRVAVVLSVLASFHAVSLGGCYFRHYFIMGLSGLFLWACLGVIAISRLLAPVPARLALWVRAAVIAGMVVQFGPRINGEVEAKYPSTKTDLMGLPAAIVTFVKSNTKPTDYVFSDGPPSIFLTTDRLRPTREGAFLDELIDSYPGKNDVEKLSAIRAQLVAHMPKVVYLDRGYSSRKVRTRAALLMPFLTKYGYRPVMDGVYFRP